MTPPPTSPLRPRPLRSRRDGWTAERQAGFVAALTTGSSVAAAAATVGLSRQAAYRLRGRSMAVAAAWGTGPRDATDDELGAAGESGLAARADAFAAADAAYRGGDGTWLLRQLRADVRRAKRRDQARRRAAAKNRVVV